MLAFVFVLMCCLLSFIWFCMCYVFSRCVCLCVVFVFVVVCVCLLPLCFGGVVIGVLLSVFCLWRDTDRNQEQDKSQHMRTDHAVVKE